MDKNPYGPVPWDILVFIAITGMGFAFSVQRYTQSHDVGKAPYRLTTSETKPRRTPPTLELGCLEKALLSKRRTSQNREMRFSGQFCHLTKTDMRQFGGLSVRNLTTGQESTIFLHGDDNTFLTDTLILSEGANRIRLEWRETAKSTPRELTAEILAQ